MFYAQNCFDFTTATSEDIALFLGTIGRNADYIRHVRVSFPEVLYLDPGDVCLSGSDISILASIQSRCPNLTTLTTSRYSTNITELRLDALDYPKIVAEALKLVDTHFRAIKSLHEIIIILVWCSVV
ncbi:hypothetical protein jhhlp_006731 [Lomentospora prolificans]|uniref:Uncharacterized protein n=1 Tax=Lomentospora prolificans TaxID=41688 RepID=A0A2N3N397_9PEZI|nr:hypothetical protein jhhlp_006731 [Lomentospora prolificans]